MVAGRPLYTPAVLALAMPSSWRSLRRFVSNSANTPPLRPRLPRPRVTVTNLRRIDTVSRQHTGKIVENPQAGHMAPTAVNVTVKATHPDRPGCTPFIDLFLHQRPQHAHRRRSW